MDEILSNLFMENMYPHLTVVKSDPSPQFAKINPVIDSPELAIAKLRVKKAYQEMTTLNKDLTDSINYARRIQTAILPNQSIMTDFSEQSFIVYKPKSIVSGDFYWFTKYDDKLLIAAVDCTGHGVPGAFLSMIGHNLLNEIVNVKDITQPAEILNRLDSTLRHLLKQGSDYNSTRDGMDIAFCSLDPKNGTMEFAGANRPMLLINSQSSTRVKGDIFPVGGAFRNPEMKYTNHTLPLCKGDSVYMFTDGYYDQFGGERQKKMMGKRFGSLLRMIHPMSALQQKKILNSFFDEWKNENEQTDDVLVMGIKI